MNSGGSRSPCPPPPPGATVIGTQWNISGGSVIANHGSVWIDGNRVVAGNLSAGNAGSGIEAVVTLPPGSAVRVRTRTASMTTEGQLEWVTYRSVSGDLDVAECGDLTFNTTSGNLHAAATGTARAVTVSGDHLPQLRLTLRKGRVPMMDAARAEHAITLHMAEYERLKAEQVSRIGFRDNLLYAQLTSVAAIAAVTASSGRLYLLLALPVTGVVLGWTHLCADHMVTMIGHYIRDDLAPRLAAAADLDTADNTADNTAVFGWEYDHHRDMRRRFRKWFQLAVNLFAFCLPALTGLTVVWIAGRLSPLLIAVSLVELLIVGILAAQMTLYAELPKRRKGGTCS